MNEIYFDRESGWRAGGAVGGMFDPGSESMAPELRAILQGKLLTALIDRLIPRSVQNAIKWPCGIAIGMQHSTAAAHIAANTALGGQPRTRT